MKQSYKSFQQISGVAIEASFPDMRLREEGGCDDNRQILTSTPPNLLHPSSAFFKGRADYFI